MPISVSPYKTWLSALSLLPPLAIFLGTLLLSYRERRWLSLVILAVGVLSVFVALIQVAQGAQKLPRLRGFFANRNHFAALLYCLTLFAVAWTVHASAVAGPASNRREYDTASIVGSIGGFTVIVVLLAGEAMARSRAGLGLTIVALFAAFALGFSDRRVGSRTTFNKLLFGAIALVVIFSAQFALYRIMERFAVDPLQDEPINFRPQYYRSGKSLYACRLRPRHLRSGLCHVREARRYDSLMPT